jgi:glycosyltransferase involved in cell wall biosynthesis
MLHRRGVDIDVWFVGSCNDLEYGKQMNSFAEREGLTELVHVVGHIDNVFDMLQKMNLGVVAAHDEAFGRVTIEYMLMKMPVVVSQSGANSELVEVGVTGDIYELHDVETLADRIEQYVRHPDLLKSQGEVAFRIARERFSAGQNAELIFEQIESVLKKD